MVRIVLAGLLVLSSLVVEVAAQQSFPTRAVTLVSPYPPGGAADLTARPLAPALEKALKQPVIVVNRTGAGGAVGTQFVSQAPADGYTLMITVFSICTIPEPTAWPAASRDSPPTSSSRSGASTPTRPW